MVEAFVPNNLAMIENVPGIMTGEFEVPANLEAGVEYTNTNSFEVDVKFTPTGMWSHGPDTLYAPTGMPDYPYQEQMAYKQNTAFALLAVDQQSNTVVAEVGTEQTIRLQPGQTLRFKMNDAPGAYDNNQGKINLTWSASEVSTGTVKPLAGQFQVPLTSLSGIDFTNNFGAALSFTFSPSGNWKPATWADCTAAGWENFAYQFAMLFPDYTSFALLALSKVQGKGFVKEVASEFTITLQPGETLTFFMNDLPSCYDDNTGNIVVAWSAK